MSARHLGGGSDAHLFLVHSEITWLVACRVIAECGIDPERAVFGLLRGMGRGRTGPPGVRCRAQDWEPAFETLPKRAGLLCARSLLDRFDREVEALVDDRAFHLYTPQTHRRFVSALRSHHLCTGFSLIEEGAGSYWTCAEVDVVLPVSRVKRWDHFKYRGRIGGAAFYDPGYEKAFAATEAAFPDFPRRHVLKGVFADIAERPPAGCSHVLAFSSTAAFGYWRFEDELEALRATFAYLGEQGVARVHYKCHPAQHDNGETARVEAVLPELAAPIEVVRLADGVSLEGLAKADPTLVFVTGLSSAGLYASLLGCSVLSYARLVAERDEEAREYVARQPAPYRDRVAYLESRDESGTLTLVAPAAGP